MRDFHREHRAAVLSGTIGRRDQGSEAHSHAESVGDPSQADTHGDFAGWRVTRHI